MGEALLVVAIHVAIPIVVHPIATQFRFLALLMGETVGVSTVYSPVSIVVLSIVTLLLVLALPYTLEIQAVHIAVPVIVHPVSALLHTGTHLVTEAGWVVTVHEPVAVVVGLIGTVLAVLALAHAVHIVAVDEPIPIVVLAITAALHTNTQLVVETSGILTVYEPVIVVVHSVGTLLTVLAVVDAVQVVAIDKPIEIVILGVTTHLWLRSALWLLRTERIGAVNKSVPVVVPAVTTLFLFGEHLALFPAPEKEEGEEEEES